MSFLIPLQKFLATHRKQVNTTFFALEILILILWTLVYLQAFRDFSEIFLMVYNLGLRFGQLAVIFYVITLTPGIITRLQWFPKLTQPIASLILPFRRHFGILMFLSAFVHMSFTTTLPYFEQYNFQPPGILPVLLQFQWMGLIAWLALLPLWLTSNDFSQKNLGKTWKLIHKLTYVALIFIFLHVALQQTKWMYVVALYLVLELISWITFWMRPKNKPPVATPTPAAQTSQSTTPPQSPPATPPTSPRL